MKYTGHPLIDVGLATLTAFVDKRRPEELTDEDVSAFAQYVTEQYPKPVWTNYLSCVFTMNSSYSQPSWDQQRRVEESRKFLQGKDPRAVGLNCAFSGVPADTIADRRHLPMLTGEATLNFFPSSRGGLPMSRGYLVAAQGCPLGSRRSEGRALSVHCLDDPDLTFRFAQKCLEENRRLLLIPSTDGKFPDAKRPKTLLMVTLLELEQHRGDAESIGAGAPSIDVYHWSNSGQGPETRVYRLPSELMGFLRKVQKAPYDRPWSRIVEAAWERKPEPKKVKKTEGPVDEGWKPQRNFLYEDLFDLPIKAARFIRTYLLRHSFRGVLDTDPRALYLKERSRETVSWTLTELFLKEVMGMNKQRLEALRSLADRLASHVVQQSDKKFFDQLYRSQRYDHLRNLLIKGSRNELARGRQPLVTLQEFLEIFESGERFEWSLARDLLLIRMIEKLYESGKQELADVDEDSQEVE